MPACDIQEIVTSSDCFSTLTAGEQSSAMLVLLCNILQTLDPMASCSIQTLMDDSACFQTLTDGQKAGAALSMLCNIQTALTSMCNAGPPENVVTGWFCGQLVTDSLTGTIYKFLGTPGTKVGWV